MENYKYKSSCNTKNQFIAKYITGKKRQKYKGDKGKKKTNDDRLKSSYTNNVIKCE